MAQRVVEQHGVLGHHGGDGPQRILPQVSDVDAVNLHAPAGHVVHAEQEPQQGALTAARGTDDTHALTLRDVEGHVLDNPPPSDGAAVGERHVPEGHPGPALLRGQGLCAVRYGARGAHHLEHGLHVHQRLPQLAVEEPEELQRRPQLQQQPVGHHEVADPRGDGPDKLQPAPADTQRRGRQHARHATREYHRLPRVERRARALAPQRRLVVTPK
mmetsp:Transcript_4078/g.16703  ORF Transcript_4078/g.16703 Transcript_4078/m.16703 type:complete len:215 (-) Transcript_4078:1168-1812(-)